MIPEIEHPQEVKSVCPGKPAWHALRGMLRLIGFDTLRRVHNVIFFVESLSQLSLEFELPTPGLTDNFAVLNSVQ